ncbi:MAG TPA: TetR/AcrR family transcriptional regulator, partial [Oceanospirillales bacterium]|nr:TetR/AcrR family transcriptional regulator [Oceanospirillales bacterium]
MKLEKKTGYHHGNLRQSIIHAVALIAQKKRSLDFQLKEIADLVGTSQPAIYKHFTGKKELLTEVAVAG